MTTIYQIPLVAGVPQSFPVGLSGTTYRFTLTYANRKQYGSTQLAPGTYSPTIVLSSFSRASTATYIDSNGHLQGGYNTGQGDLGLPNIPRIDNATGSPLLLIEAAATNLILNSASLDPTVSGTAWTLGINAQLISDGTGPDLYSTGAVFGCEANTGNCFVSQNYVFKAGLSYVASIWAKKVTGTPEQSLGELLKIVYEDPTLPPALIPWQGSGITTSWQRFQIPFTVPANLQGTFYTATDFGLGNQVAVFGAQLELGYQASSFIYTGSAPVTRAADIAFVPSSVLSNLEGGWVLQIADQSGNVLVSGIPLVTGANLLAQYAHLGFSGGLYVQTTNNPDAVPTFSNLGSDALLYWVTP